MKQRSVNLQELLMRRVDTEPSEDGAQVWDAALVRPGLYVGSLRSALDVENLAAHNVTSVLTVAGQLVVELPSSIEHMQINIPDHPVADILEILPRALPFLDKVLLNANREERSVLVHCASGISRSVSVCCAWLMVHEKEHFTVALERVRSSRPWANPNVGFSSQLTVLSDHVSAAADASIEEIIAAAREEYSRKLGGRTLMDNLLTQRTVANELHAAVDEIENALKSVRVMEDCPAEQRERWRLDLTAVLDSLDRVEGKAVTAPCSAALVAPGAHVHLSSTADEVPSVFHSAIGSSLANTALVADKPAAMIRQAARAKALRLLDDLST